MPVRVVIRRICESASRTLPLLAVLFVPVAAGIPWLYRWSDPKVVAADEIIRHKHVYLNVPFFIIRAIIYFAGWLMFSHFLNKWSHVQDATGRKPFRRVAIRLR